MAQYQVPTRRQILRNMWGGPPLCNLWRDVDHINDALETFKQRSDATPYIVKDNVNNIVVVNWPDAQLTPEMRQNIIFYYFRTAFMIIRFKPEVGDHILEKVKRIEFDAMMSSTSLCGYYLKMATHLDEHIHYWQQILKERAEARIPDAPPIEEEIKAPSSDMKRKMKRKRKESDIQKTQIDDSKRKRNNTPKDN